MVRAVWRGGCLARYGERLKRSGKVCKAGLLYGALGYQRRQSHDTMLFTSQVESRSNAKYGKTKDDTMWFNCLIFTNHADAMIIPEDDRRIAVFSNPTSKRDDDYYMKLHAALDNDYEARRLYWYLMRRGVAQFNPAAPPMTAAKIQMIDASKSPIDEIHEHLIENMAGDVATRKQVTVHAKRVARSLGFDQIEHSPQNAVRRIWRQMQSLKPDEKNGYRVQIDTTREEIRALRRSHEWLSQASTISSAQIVEEMWKNSETVVNLVQA